MLRISARIIHGAGQPLAHKLRSLLTMLGMIFGVGAVVAMLSITAGAQKEMMSFIDQLGVNNIIVEAHEAVDRNELQTRARDFAGPDVPRFPRDLRKRPGPGGDHAAQAFQAAEAAAQDDPGAAAADRRDPNFVEINSLKLVAGRFFTEDENQSSAPVCVLGETAKVNLLGYDQRVGKYVKVNDTWLQVIGVLTPQATGDTDVEGLRRRQPQQPGHRAAEHGDAPVRRQHQLSEGRDRRHLHEGRA